MRCQLSRKVEIVYKTVKNQILTIPRNISFCAKKIGHGHLCKKVFRTSSFHGNKKLKFERGNFQENEKKIKNMVQTFHHKISAISEKKTSKKLNFNKPIDKHTINLKSAEGSAKIGFILN